MAATTTKVCFALKTPGASAAAAAGKRKRKRKRPLAAVATANPHRADPDHAAETQHPRQLVGCFNTVDEDAAAAADQPRGLAKQPRLQLEDARAKAKRLQDEGSTLAEAGRFRAAMARWLEAIDVDPANAVAFELLAQASMALCEDFRAIQFALRATELAPAWGDGFHTLARCHLNFGELELALQHMNKAIELNGASEELVTERQEILDLVARQRTVLATREAQEAQTSDADALQALSCLKHLALRGQTIASSSAAAAAAVVVVDDDASARKE